jgi:hypothetical protein
MQKLARPLMVALVAAALTLGPRGAAAAKTPAVDLRAREVTDTGVWAKIGPGGARVKLTLDPKLQRAA